MLDIFIAIHITKIFWTLASFYTDAVCYSLSKANIKSEGEIQTLHAIFFKMIPDRLTELNKQ